jgi:hypothetical protein
VINSMVADSAKAIDWFCTIKLNPSSFYCPLILKIRVLL